MKKTIRIAKNNAIIGEKSTNVGVVTLMIGAIGNILLLNSKTDGLGQLIVDNIGTINTVIAAISSVLIFGVKK